MLSRRILLLAAPTTLLSAKSGIRVGASTDSLAVDAKNLESLVAAVGQLKQLGYEGFETGYQNLREQFDRPDAAYERLHKTGMRLLGIRVELKNYDPQTAIAPWTLIQKVADAAKALDAEHLILGGELTVHPLALRAKADALTRAAKYCKGLGVTVSYEGPQAQEVAGQADSSVHFVLSAPYTFADWRRVDAVRVGSEMPKPPSSWKGWVIADQANLAEARTAIRKAFGV